MLEDGMVPEQKKPEYYANMQRECPVSYTHLDVYKRQVLMRWSSSTS